MLDRMAELGRITPQEAAAAKAAKLGYKGTKIPGGCESSAHPYFCLYVRHEILSNPDFGRTARARLEMLNRGGLTIRTTLDPATQAAANRAIRKYVHASDRAVASEALVQPGTGAIRAHGGQQAVRPEQGQERDLLQRRRGRRARRRRRLPGRFHVQGLHPDQRAEEGHEARRRPERGRRVPRAGLLGVQELQGREHRRPDAHGHQRRGLPGLEDPPDRHQDLGEHLLHGAGAAGGALRTVTTAKSLGIRRSDGRKLQEYETFALGINEMDPVTVANAYAAIAARGRYCAPMAISRITDRDGRATTYRPKCRQALDPGIADATAEVLSGVFTEGTMRGVGGIGRDAAGKTGTTDAYATAWFAGFTPDLAAAVSIGDPRGSSDHKLTGVTIGGRYYGAVAGATLPGPIWKDTMIGALKGVPPTSFTAHRQGQVRGVLPGLPTRVAADRRR
ncbi:penicillin-binding transpeptidase domain-containing protein [Nonomuraea dietziae]|uniref:penicillin-binding transpeptidase domain-containing protein n=1 Tax=Nonomuraea dietziae TaxID=65515 RepID=UPI0031DCC920